MVDVLIDSISASQKSSPLSTSPLARVTRAAKVRMSMDSLMKCTEPSTNNVLTPPVAQIA
jgi:hypothetical protein